MKSLAFSIILLLVFYTFSFSLADESQDDSWFKGTVYVRTMISDSLMDTEPIREGICIFDFPGGSCEIVEIPFGSTIYINHSTQRPMVLFQRTSYFGNPDIRFMNPMLSLYSISTIDKTEKGFSLAPVDEQYSFDVVPIRVLASQDEGDPYSCQDYYLCYGTSENAELEIQLMRETKGFFNAGRTVLCTFPVDTDLSAFRFKVSGNGKVAVSHRKLFDYTVNVYDRYAIIPLDDSNCCSLTVDWVDDNTLAYFALDPSDSRREKYVLKFWHVDTNEIETVLPKENNVNNSISRAPQAVSIDEDAEYIAMFFKASILADDPRDQRSIIKIVSLKDGKEFDFIPWTEQVPDSFLDWDAPRNLFGFGLSNKGIAYYDPFDMLVTDMFLDHN